MNKFSKSRPLCVADETPIRQYLNWVFSQTPSPVKNWEFTLLSIGNKNKKYNKETNISPHLNSCACSMHAVHRDQSCMSTSKLRKTNQISKFQKIYKLQCCFNNGFQANKRKLVKSWKLFSSKIKKLDNIRPSLEQGGLRPTSYWTLQPMPTMGWLADQVAWQENARQFLKRAKSPEFSFWAWLVLS
jgi:hypothetical protein